MDPINLEKFQAMNKYKKNQFLNNLIFYSSIAMTCSLFFYNPFWFPSLCSSMKFFLFVSLPNIGAFFFSPKYLFIVCNIIIVFLIGESRLMGSKTSPDTEIYEEYVKRSESLQRLPTIVEEKKENIEIKLELPLVDEIEKREYKEEREAKEEREEQEEQEEQEQEQEENEKEEDLDGEEELGLPVEELNKRVEDFIAKTIKERRLEAKLLVYGA